MGNWADLPLDIALRIIEHKKFYEDVVIFGQVCSHWRCAMKHSNIYTTAPSRQTPWLMLTAAAAPPTFNHQLYNLHNATVLPPPTEFNDDINGGIRRLLFHSNEEDWSYYSSRGWIISVTKLSFHVTIVDPFYGHVITTPSVPKAILRQDNNGDLRDGWEYDLLSSKFALSETPSGSGSGSGSYDLTVGMIFPMSGSGSVAFWRRGEDEWTWRGRGPTPYELFTSLIGKPCELFTSLMDINFCNGQFYVLDNIGRVMTFGNKIGITNPPVPRLVTNLNWSYDSPDQCYLVESSSSYNDDDNNTLLVVTREQTGERNNNNDDYDFWTVRFMVWEVDVENGEAKQVESLGNMALFVGFNSSFSLDASIVRGCKSNCIYYTDDPLELFTEAPLNCGCDMGVYDLALGKKTEDFYDGSLPLSETTPPLWIQSPSNY